MEQLNELYWSWYAESETIRKSNLAKKFLDDADSILGQFPQRYASQRALYLRAQYLFELEQWDEAANDWSAMSDRWPDSYLSQLGLFNAAVAAEQAGNIQVGIDYLLQLIEKWDSGIIVPRAKFSLGRLFEQQSEYLRAQETYDELIDQHEGSNWAVISRNRVIALETQGLLLAE